MFFHTKIVTMKTVIAENYQKEKILHDLSSSFEGSFAGTEVLSLQNVMKVERDDAIVSLLALRSLLSKHMEEFPIYAKMFQFPSFIKEILTFTKTCMLWGITAEELPNSTENEIEIQGIVRYALTLPLSEKRTYAKTDEMLMRLNDQDIELAPSFYTDPYLYKIHQQLLNRFPLLVQEEVQPTKELRYALNTRQEIEAIAQDICKREQSCNVILVSYDATFPVLKQVFDRYQIPFSYYKDGLPLHLPHIYACLCAFAFNKDKTTFLQAISNHCFEVACPNNLYAYLEQHMVDVRKPDVISDFIQHSPFENETENLKRLEEQCESFFTRIQEDVDLLLSASTPQEIFMKAFEVLRKSSYLSTKTELTIGLRMRDSLQEVLETIEVDDIPFLIQSFNNITISNSSYDNDFCMVSDLTHPVSVRDVTYVIGCDGKSYPGFPSLKGIFDETYVSQVASYPSLEMRHSSYLEQLSWLERSARNTIFYSYPTNDYEGRENQLAYDIECEFEKNAQKRWPMDLLELPKELPHEIKPLTAHQLFFKNECINGSISTIERWFACPYAYFLQSGLKLRKLESNNNDVRTSGNVQHDVFDQAVKKFGNEYAQLNEEDVRTLIAPYFEALLVSHPNEKIFIEISKERIVQSLKKSLQFLDDFERNTSFKPAQTEFRFDQEIIDGIQLHGIIDRIDMFYHSFRVIDYKSSDRNIHTDQYYAGLQLQLLTYVYIAKKLLDASPAGAYYCSMADTPISIPAIKVSRNEVSENTIEEGALKSTFVSSRRMKGWTFSSDATALDENGKHIVSVGKPHSYDEEVEIIIPKLYQYFKDSLNAGVISLTPTEDACLYCDYRNICHFHGEYKKPTSVLEKEANNGETL